MAVCLYVNIEELKAEERFRSGLSLIEKTQPWRTEQIYRMKDPLDQARSLGAGLLLQNMAVRYLHDKDFAKAVDGTDVCSAKKKSKGFPFLELLLADEISMEALFEEAALFLNDAEKLTIGRTESGSPLIEGLGVFVSLSHSGSLVICAMSKKRCGVDIECMDLLKGMHTKKEGYEEKILQMRKRLVSRYFFKGEQELLEKAGESAEEWQETFCRLWCLKEAYGKMKQTGLKDGLLFDFCTETKEKVSIYDLSTDCGYVGALCLLEEN